MSDIKKLLGKRIKEIRTAKHYTQEYLAELTGLGSTSISKIENGLYHPTDENLEKISKALEVEPYKLYKYNHLLPNSEIREILHEIIDKISDDKLSVVYRVVNELAD